MILKLIGIDVLREHGIDEAKQVEIASKIEARYINEVSAMFVAMDNKKRPFELDVEFDSSPRESTNTKPADAPPHLPVS